MNATTSHVRRNGKACAHHAYRLTCEDFDELWSHAGGRCQICRIAPEGTPQGYLVVDHDSTVGQWAVRGLLCHRCNTSYEWGHLRDAAGNALLEDPWYRRLLDRAGIDGLTIPEPPMDTVVDAGSVLPGGSIWYRRDPGGWQHLYRPKLPPDPITWKLLVWSRGPHRIRILGGPGFFSADYCRRS